VRPSKVNCPGTSWSWPSMCSSNSARCSGATVRAYVGSEVCSSGQTGLASVPPSGSEGPASGSPASGGPASGGLASGGPASGWGGPPSGAPTAGEAGTTAGGSSGSSCCETAGGGCGFEIPPHAQSRRLPTRSDESLMPLSLSKQRASTLAWTSQAFGEAEGSSQGKALPALATRNYSYSPRLPSPSPPEGECRTHSKPGHAMGASPLQSKL
jgi:hypothetical protein